MGRKRTRSWAHLNVRGWFLVDNGVLEPVMKASNNVRQTKKEPFFGLLITGFHDLSTRC